MDIKRNRIRIRESVIYFQLKATVQQTKFNHKELARQYVNPLAFFIRLVQSIKPYIHTYHHLFFK